MNLIWKVLDVYSDTVDAPATAPAEVVAVPVAPKLPRPLRGWDGILAADRILKELNGVGMLFGSTICALYRGEDISRIKDVNVYVLALDCHHHPRQWEERIDWWLTHSPRERATNSGTVGLFWHMRLTRDANVTPGLYAPKLSLLQWVRGVERGKFPHRKERLPRCAHYESLGLPTIPIWALLVQSLPASDPIAQMCAPYTRRHEERRGEV